MGTPFLIYIISNSHIMIVIESKRRMLENIKAKYPDAVIHDVTSHATDSFVRLSPFYPHGGIPVPFSNNVTAMSVESVWQGLKDYEGVGIDTSVFRNSTMKDLKRTKRKFGNIIGHRKGVNGSEHLGYIEARKEIYLPTYIWMLEHKALALVDRIKKESENGTVVLLDYNTNEDIEKRGSALSHASIIKGYIEGKYDSYKSVGTSCVDVEGLTSGYTKGMKVRHQKFGEGEVIEVQTEKGRIVVDFASEGMKTLSIALAHLEKV